MHSFLCKFLIIILSIRFNFLDSVIYDFSAIEYDITVNYTVINVVLWCSAPVGTPIRALK